MGVFVNIEQGKGSGPVAGDCKHKTHTNWIVAENCTIPTTRPETQTKMGKTTARTRASVEFEDIQMKKSMDLASPMLMEWNLLGDARKVTIHFTDEKDWYLSLVMENTILTKLDIDADEAEHWWRMAADQGYAAAQYNLGGMFSRKLSESLSRDEALDWLDENPEADKDEYTSKQKEVEAIANPIMRNVYQGAGGPGGGEEEEDYDFGDDEL